MLLQIPKLRPIERYSTQKRYLKTAKGKAAQARSQRMCTLRKDGMSEEEIAVVKTALDLFFTSDPQQALCPIFNKPMSEVGKYAVDHDHKRKKFRGIISQRANHILGLAYDDPEILRRLADYLELDR